MMDVDPKPGKDNPNQRDSRMRLKCLACGRVVLFTETDLLDYIHHGWPLCCGEAMVVSRETTDGG